MANSMDTILVKYGAKNIDVIYDHSEHPEVKTVTLPEFLALKPEELSEEERKIQEAIRLVYELNGKEPPLYHNFINQNPKIPPLTINCTGKYDVPAAAVFVKQRNEIGFIDKAYDLVDSLAHELQHAQQHTQLEIQQIFDGDDNQAKKETLLLNEAEAFFTGARASIETSQKADSTLPGRQEAYLKLSQKYTRPDGTPDISTIKQKMIMSFLHHFLNGKPPIYRLQAEMNYPLRAKDTGLKHIPKYYGLTDDFLEILKQFPREPQFEAGIIRQCFANHQEDQLPTVIEKILSKQPNRAKYQKSHILNTFLNDLFIDKDKDKNLLDTLFHLKGKDGKDIFDKETLAAVLADSVYKGKNGFMACLQIIQGQEKTFPLTSEDFVHYPLLSRLSPYSPEGRAQMMEMFPILVQLKGKDGTPLIQPQKVVDYLVYQCIFTTDLEDISLLLKTLQDENGNLPFSRDLFDVHKDPKDLQHEYTSLKSLLGSKIAVSQAEYIKKESMCVENQLLRGLNVISCDKKGEERSLKILPTLMALKDKDGNPIISQQNIDSFSGNGDLKKQVQTYKRPAETSKKPSELIQRLSEGESPEGNKSANRPKKAPFKNRKNATRE